MAWIRQLESKKWAATVRLRNGGDQDRITDTFALKEQAENWARETEAADRRGEWIDPKLGQVTIGELWNRYGHARRLEKASRARDLSHWRTHVEPRWGRTRAGSILKPDITAWVVQLERGGVGAATIEAAIGVLRSILEISVEARLIRVNPCTGVKAPRRDAHLDRILDDHEDEILLSNMDSLWPGAGHGRLFAEMMLYCGLRWEEAAALRRERVDMRQRLLHIGPVMERDGTIREYPKSPAGVRPVPVDEDLWPRLRDHVLTVAPGGLVFTAAEGGPLSYTNWRDRVFNKALIRRVPMSAAEIEGYVAQRRAAGRRSGWRPDYYREVALLDDPQPTPHDLRHTYGTRLGESGIPPHEIMSLMGHANLRSVQRYLHAREGRFDRARQAIASTRKRSSTLH